MRSDAPFASAAAPSGSVECSAQPTRVGSKRHRDMERFGAFCAALPPGTYCAECLAEMFRVPEWAVVDWLHRHTEDVDVGTKQCANCDVKGETYRCRKRVGFARS